MSATSIRFPEDLETLPVIVAVRGSPAWNALLRMSEYPPTPGMIVPISEEELESLRKDTLALQVTEGRAGAS